MSRAENPSFLSIKGIDPGIDINKDQGIIKAFARVGIKKAMRLIKKKDNKDLSTIKAELDNKEEYINLIKNGIKIGLCK